MANGGTRSDFVVRSCFGFVLNVSSDAKSLRSFSFIFFHFVMRRFRVRMNAKTNYVKKKKRKSYRRALQEPAEIRNDSFSFRSRESLRQFSVHIAALIKKERMSDGHEERKACHMSCAEARSKDTLRRHSYLARIQSREQRKRESERKKGD